MILNYNVLSTLTLMSLHLVAVSHGRYTDELNEARELECSIPEESTQAVDNLHRRVRHSASTSSRERKILSPQVERFDHMKIMKKSWKVNKDQLTSREQDANELLTLMKDLRGQTDHLLQRKRALVEPDRSRIGSSFQEIEVLADLFDTLKHLNGRKILELGDNDHLPISNAELVKLTGSKYSTGGSYVFPDEINTLIARKAWPHLGPAILTGLEELILEHKSFSTQSLRISSKRDSLVISAVLLWWKCIFKYIDFLTKHEQLDQDAIRSLGPGMMRQVVQFAKFRFAFDVGQTLDTGSPYMTRRWYWPLLQGSFKALSQDQENFIDAYVLLDLRHREFITRMVENRHPYLHSRHCKAFAASFNSQWYLKFLEDKLKTNLAHSLSPENEDIIIKDIGRIIDVMTDTTEINFQNRPLYRAQLNDLIVNLVHMVDFIEHNIFPGVIERVKDHPKFEMFVVESDFVRVAEKLEDIDHEGQTYCSYAEYDLSSIDIDMYNSKFEIWKKEASEVYDQLDKKIHAYSQNQLQVMQYMGYRIEDYHEKAQKLTEWLNDESPLVINNPSSDDDDW